MQHVATEQAFGHESTGIAVINAFAVNPIADKRHLFLFFFKNHCDFAASAGNHLSGFNCGGLSAMLIQRHNYVAIERLGVRSVFVRRDIERAVVCENRFRVFISPAVAVFNPRRAVCFDAGMKNPAGLPVKNAASLDIIKHGAVVHCLKCRPRFAGQLKGNRKAMGICFHGLLERFNARALDVPDFCNYYTHFFLDFSIGFECFFDDFVFRVAKNECFKVFL